MIVEPVTQEDTREPDEPIERPEDTPTVSTPSQTETIVNKPVPSTKKITHHLKKSFFHIICEACGVSIRKGKHIYQATAIAVVSSTQTTSKRVDTPASTQSVQKTPAEPVKEITPEPTIAMHTFYLMVGVDSGTRGLPVLYNGREITKTE